MIPTRYNFGLNANRRFSSVRLWLFRVQVDILFQLDLGGCSGGE